MWLCEFEIVDLCCVKIVALHGGKGDTQVSTTSLKREGCIRLPIQF